MKIEMLFGPELATLEFEGVTGLKGAMTAIYIQRKEISGVAIYKDDGTRLEGRLLFKDINLKPSPMAKVAFESRDYSLGVIMNLAGCVMMYPDLEVRELDDNYYVRIDDTIWAIIGEQSAFYAENFGDTQYIL